MNILYNSIYKHDLKKPEKFKSLDQDIECEIAIIGGGFTGLSSAIELAEAGLSVCVFEKEYIGFGASGRNGGHISQGWSTDFSKIKKNIDEKFHKMAWDAGIEAVDIVKARIKKYKINCDLKMGYIYAALHKRHLSELYEMKDEWSNNGYKGLKFLEDTASINDYVKTDRYVGGIFDEGSGHLHPMKYLHGLAEAAKGLGVKIFENTKIIKKEDDKLPILLTDKNIKIKSTKVILCGNAYLEGLVFKPMKDKLAPAVSSVMATEPINNIDIVLKDCAVADCNTALNYYRLDYKNRLIFGGASIYSNITPKDATPMLLRKMTYLFPSLKNIGVEMSWSGKIGITLSRIPHFGKLDSNIYFAQGYSGHGVALTALAGKMIAEDILKTTNRFKVFSSIKHMTFPGGIFRTPVLALGMSWYKFKDWLQI